MTQPKAQGRHAPRFEYRMVDRTCRICNHPFVGSTNAIHCPACRTDLKNARRHTDLEPGKIQRTCRHCGETKTLADFERRPNGTYHIACRVCVAACLDTGDPVELHWWNEVPAERSAGYAPTAPGRLGA